jgi:glycosyltransferase involved in cell wall biosynthesis
VIRNQLKMNEPKVSILTTVYNREKYLAACIESVLASTFPDWELIIVDDRSQDNSLAIAKSYAAKDPRIQVYVNEHNLGDYANRNKAASYAKGKYLKYLDADDLIYPYGLEIMVHTMEQFPEAALGISQEVAEDYKPYPFMMHPEETFRREFLQRGVLGLGPTGTIIRRDAFEAIGGFTGTRYIGDTELWYKLALYYPVVKMVPGLTFWRRHDDQEITKGRESFFYLENSFKHAIKTLNLQNFPLGTEQRDKAIEKIYKRFSRNILKMIAKGELKKAFQIIGSVKFSWWQLLKAIK